MELLSTPEEKHLMTLEERAIIEKQLGAYGVVDALLCNQPETKEHPEDRRWAVSLDTNANIIKSVN